MVIPRCKYLRDKTMHKNEQADINSSENVDVYNLHPHEDGIV